VRRGSCPLEGTHDVGDCDRIVHMQMMVARKVDQRDVRDLRRTPVDHVAWQITGCRFGQHHQRRRSDAAQHREDLGLCISLRARQREARVTRPDPAAVDLDRSALNQRVGGTLRQSALAHAGSDGGLLIGKDPQRSARAEGRVLVDRPPQLRQRVLRSARERSERLDQQQLADPCGI
jgi:hypothetical protein